MSTDVYKQVAERAIWTFIQAFCAMFVVTDLSSASGAVAAGIAAALSVIKSFAATRIGDDSTSLV